MRLTVCAVCSSDCVNPVKWSEHDSGRWWIRLRCGACEARREVIVTDEVATRYDEELASGTELIEAEMRRIERLRMHDDVATFIEALRRGLIEPADFTSPQPSIE